MKVKVFSERNKLKEGQMQLWVKRKTDKKLENLREKPTTGFQPSEKGKNCTE